MGKPVRSIPIGYHCASGSRADTERLIKLKKLDEAADNVQTAAQGKGQEIAITLNTIILAGLERGLTMNDIHMMQLGQVVDFVQDYNDRQKEAEKNYERRSKMKKLTPATQEQIDSMFG